MNDKLKPALLGGLVVGVLSAIPFVNYCCCIWSIGGGVLAAFIYIKGSSVPVRTGDGAVVGGLAGIVGGIIYLVIGLPIAFFFGMAAMQEQLNRSGVALPISGTLLLLFGGLLAAIILAVLALLGGVIGVAIFEKRKGDGLAPPPPQNFGGGPAGYGSSP